MSIHIGFQVIPLAAPCANGAIIISDDTLLLSFGTRDHGQATTGQTCKRTDLFR